jgi:hypothetical protein
VAYRAEIEIGVKGVKQLDRFQSQLERLSNEVDRVNKKKFTVANLSSYNEALRKANENLNQTQIETDKAGKATGLYKKNLDSFVTALLASNDAQDLNNKLVRQEIQDRGAATQALKAYNAELASATQRGAQTTMAGSYLRGQPTFGPEPAPGFDPAAGAARTRVASLAADAISKGRETERLAQQEIELIGKVSQADRRAFIELNNDKIRGVQKRLDAEIDSIGTKLNAAIKADNVEMARFDKDLARRTQLTQEAESLYLKIREDSENRIATKRREGLATARKLEKDIAREKLAREARMSNAISSGLIGGAFPLLFGQGGGAAIGGGLGGFAGGLAGGQMGFALSLVGTQFGAFADQIVGKSAELGQALNPLTADLDALIGATGNTGSEIAILIGKLKEADESSAALTLATDELVRLVGADGVAAFEEFGAETIELSNEFSRAMTIMMAAVAGLINSSGVLRGIVAGLEDSVLNSQIRRTILKGGPEAEKLRATFTKRAPTLAEQSAGREPTTRFDRPTEDTRNLMRQMNAERAKASKNAAEETLQSKKRLSIHSAESVILRKKLEISKIEGDLTNDKIYTLRRDIIFQQARAKLEKEGANRDNIAVERQTALNTLATQRNSLLEKGAKTGSKTVSQLEAQQQRAQALTASLERQLETINAAGTEEAERIKIEQTYRQNLEKIAKLRNQSEASEQRRKAAQIKMAALAKLAFDQEKKRAKALRDAVAPLKQIRDSQEANLTASREYNRLVMEGMLPAEAKRITEFNKQVGLLLKQKTEAIQLVETDILRAKANGANTTALEEQLDILKKQQAAIKGEASKGPGKGKTPEERIRDQIAVIQGGLNDLLDPTNRIIELSTTIGDAFSESFKGIIDGSMSAREALANLFQRTADHFLDMAVEIIAAQVKMQALKIGLNFFGGGIPGLAKGGPVENGSPYIVGEKGPELFVPNTSGTIIPNNKLGASSGGSGVSSTNVVVNVDAKGSSASGDSGAGKQLGGLIGAAVQAELIKQQRPGGLLSR